MAAVIFVNHRFAPSFKAEEYQVDLSRTVKDSALSPAKEKIAVIIFVGTIVGLVMMSLTGGDSTIPPLIGALLMIFCGILKPREVPNNMGMPVILCSVGMLPIATALVNTGADVLIANAIDKILTYTNSSFAVCPMATVAFQRLPG